MPGSTKYCINMIMVVSASILCKGREYLKSFYRISYSIVSALISYLVDTVCGSSLSGKNIINCLCVFSISKSGLIWVELKSDL